MFKIIKENSEHIIDREELLDKVFGLERKKLSTYLLRDGVNEIDAECRGRPRVEAVKGEVNCTGDDKHRRKELGGEQSVHLAHEGEADLRGRAGPPGAKHHVPWARIF